MLISERRWVICSPLDPEKRHGVEPHHPGSQTIKNPHDVARYNLLRRAGRIEPIEHGLPRLEVMQINPATRFAIDAFDLACRAPAARFAHLRIGIARIDSARNVP